MRNTHHNSATISPIFDVCLYRCTDIQGFAHRATRVSDCVRMLLRNAQTHVRPSLSSQRDIRVSPFYQTNTEAPPSAPLSDERHRPRVDFLSSKLPR